MAKDYSVKNVVKLRTYLQQVTVSNDNTRGKKDSK